MFARGRQCPAAYVLSMVFIWLLLLAQEGFWLRIGNHA